MDFTNLFQSTLQGNVDESTLLNNGNNENNNNFMVPTSSSPNSQNDDDIAKFLMEAEAFLLNENPPPNSVSMTGNAAVATTTTLAPPMPAFEIQQFNSNPSTSVTTPTTVKDSMAQQPQQPQQPMISFFQSSDAHITMVNPNPVPQQQKSSSSSSATSSRKPTTPAQRRQANRMREPIFVTEAPQNAYKKKKKSRSTSSDDDDSDEDAAQLKKMTSKQRRQLRNKISARNFRVRRKEYIEQLESQVERQDKEIETLKSANVKLEKVNQELFQELQYWRTMVPTPPGTTSSNTSDNNSTSSPPNITTFPPLDLDQFSLFDFSGDTHVAHAAIPDFDFSHIFNDKLLTNGSSSDGGDVPEDHERDAQGNIVLKPTELIKVYPLFVPALMSMIVRHTFTLHYAAYYTSTLETPLDNSKMLDLLGQHEWMQQAFNSAAATATNTAITASGNRRRGSHNSEDEKTHRKENRTKSIQGENEEQVDEEDEQTKVDAFIREHYLHYAFWRMCGLSHQQVYDRFLACYRAHNNCAQKFEQKQEKKWSKANLQRQMSTMSAYVTVSNTVLHHPERLPLIASVLKRNNYTKITAQQQKSFLGLPNCCRSSSSSTPSITADQSSSSSSRKKTFPLLKTIKLGGSSRRD
ncbi:hypothetical protein BDA99DRAFT_609413 [Phascolomyces articulosus]|uniref:BZIP domain-containing protein n=1 Tax=Phascolomyces articulosus TaxID=60185 RepID=A0AAD5JNS7_9FUNG|nr:hypothetical protein BDA99DRAFT_609413 [Phascolomyces articulosus]